MHARTPKHGRDHRPGGVDPIRIADFGVPRMISGGLYNDATILAGAGFTATWDKDGGAPSSSNYYTITFDTPFDNPPIVQLTANNNNSPGTDGAYDISLDPSGRHADRIVVFVTNFDGTTGDGGFDFLCIEPGV